MYPMADKKVRIDESVLDKIKKFRKKKKENRVKYPSDKYFVQVASLELLNKAGKNE